MGELKVYLMPDGTKSQYREGEQPECAVIYEPKKKAEPKAKPDKKAK